MTCLFCSKPMTRPWPHLDMWSCKECEVILSGEEVHRQVGDKAISHYRYLQKIKYPRLHCPLCGQQQLPGIIAKPPSLELECCNKFIYIRIEDTE